MTGILKLLPSYHSSPSNPNADHCLSSTCSDIIQSPNHLQGYRAEQPFSNYNVHTQIKSCIRKSHILQIHSQLIRKFIIQIPSISLMFLSRATALWPLDNSSYPIKIFSQISDHSLSHYNKIIRGYSLSGTPHKGFYLYRQMLTKGICPNPLTSTFVIKSCIKMSSFVGGLQVHNMILVGGHRSDSLLLTTLMDFYSFFEKRNEACKVFDEITQRDTVAWNVLISCYIRNNRIKDSLSIFDIMQASPYGSHPDNVTCLLLLQACAHLGALDFGKRIHTYIDENGFGSALNICNALISMYSRCGSLDQSFLVFNGISKKNVVTWSAMISGLAMNGYGREAIEAFNEMQKAGIFPDDQTFTGVLSACSHSGLVDEGMMLFESIAKEYGILPNIHHYGCMVDLLGRAGMLHRAYGIITTMPVKPDFAIWRTLLGACKIHGQVALGERVVEHLIELKAQEAGDYVLLLNIYSSVGDWEKVIEVRKFMKDKGIQTTPGCSTIELNGKLHEFVVDDISHPRKDEIYDMLDEIGKQLKIAGYVVEVSSELHKLDDDEEKGFRLSYHSEKLALAFGVLSTPPNTKIRVAKNLRICVDCHNFAKFLCGVYNREVIIRDRTRFHHFCNGHCSCNDYW